MEFSDKNSEIRNKKEKNPNNNLWHSHLPPNPHISIFEFKINISIYTIIYAIQFKTIYKRAVQRVTILTK